MNLNYPQRRVFRDRGGPTDRRLPKHNARRRKQHPSNGVRSEIHEDEGTSDHESDSLSCGSLRILNSEEEEFKDDEGGLRIVEENHDGGADRSKADSVSNEADTALQSSVIDHGAAANLTDTAEDAPPLPFLAEIRHLRRRIRNVREVSIQTSREAIASDLTKYKDNVLNATQNCVNEWRSIARHYSCDNDNNNNNVKGDEPQGLSAALRTEVGLDVFQLVQLSIQSGPLSGAKPGYFKRCGAAVARAVLEFLEEVVPRHEVLGIECMGFSSRQLETMNKWKRDAEKAVANDKPPSKSFLKKMQQQQQRQQQQRQQQQAKKGKKKK